MDNINRRYRIEHRNPIGEGTFGKVLCGTRRKVMEEGEIPGDEDQMAFKYIKHDKNQGYIPYATLREFKTMKTLGGHANIVNAVDFVFDKSAVSTDSSPTDSWSSPSSASSSSRSETQFCIVMEKCAGTLQSTFYDDDNRRQRVFTLDEIKTVMYQILAGVGHIHNNGFIHRDLHPGNILVQSCGTIKIADFGLACTHENIHELCNHEAYVVAKNYRAPELIVANINDTRVIKCGTSVDMWSIGCVFAFLMSGKTTFKALSTPEMLVRIFSMTGLPTKTTWPDFFEPSQRVIEALWKCIKDKNDMVTDKERKSFPTNLLKTRKAEVQARIATRYPSIHAKSPFYDLLDKLLALDPKKRISAADALKHEFFSGLCNRRMADAKKMFARKVSDHFEIKN